MPTVEVKCPYCGAMAMIAFAQVVHGCELQWWESFSCHACGAQIEADGGEDMPPERRKVLLEQEGNWSVIAFGRPTPDLLRAARFWLGLSIAQLPALKARLPGVLATGTRSEMEVLARRLNRSAGSDLSLEVVRG